MSSRKLKSWGPIPRPCIRGVINLPAGITDAYSRGTELSALGGVVRIQPMLANLHFSAPEWNRHHRHPPALCRQGNMHQMVKLGLCTRAEYLKSMLCVKGVKRRNEFWKMLGYPNLVRAREAKKEHARRRRMILGPGPSVWCGYNVDHSVDHLLEICAPALPQRRSMLPEEASKIVRVAKTLDSRGRRYMSPTAQV